MKQRCSITSSARNGAAESKQNLRSQAQHYGRRTDLHWRRHKKLIDTDGQWLDMESESHSVP